MQDCHQAQRRALEAMNSIHKGAPAEPTTAFHHQSTLNLEISLFKYYTCPQKNAFCSLFFLFLVSVHIQNPEILQPIGRRNSLTHLFLSMLWVGGEMHLSRFWRCSEIT